MHTIENTKNVLTKLWNKDTGVRLAYQIENFILGNHPERPAITTREKYFDNEKMLQEQLFYIRERNIGWDYYVPALIPHTVQGLTASGFGCEIVYPEDEAPWTKRVIESPDEIKNLKKPSIYDGKMRDALELTKYLVEQSNGRYPVTTSEINGPLVVAEMICGYEDFLVAMYTHPKEVHILLDMIADVIIEFEQAQRNLCGEFVPNLLAGSWSPDGIGITVADDLLAIVSPDLYEEFGVPYLSRISDAFGGIMVHSCGDIGMNLDNLGRLHNLKALNFQATESDFKAVVDAMGGDVLLIPTIGLNQPVQFSSNVEYTEHVLNTMNDDTRLLLVLGYPTTDTTTKSARADEGPMAIQNECISMLDQRIKVINGGAGVEAAR